MYQQLDKFNLSPNARGRSVFIVQLWWLVQATLFGLSPQFLFGWRRFLLRLFGAKIGKKVLVRPTARITYPWKVIIGDYCWIGDNATLYSLGNIEIGDHVVISQYSYLCTGSHDYTKPTFDQFTKPIIIHDQAWIASDVFVAPGVEIGEGTIISARSSVYHSIAEGLICKGNPAKPFKTREVLL